MNNEYQQDKQEEAANTISHGTMAALMLLALPFTAVWAYTHHGMLASITTSIYVISIFLMLLSSTIYHVMAHNTSHKYVGNIIDHSMIYVAIAGTYTPIALVTIGGWQGIVIVSVQWTLTILGIIYKSIAINKYKRLSYIIYLCMGWTILLFSKPFVQNASWQMIFFIILGCVLYTIGALFFLKKGWFKYHHLVWHIFINLATAAHFTAVVFCL